MPAFHSLAAELGSAVSFVAVYIQEAHAHDEWPISSSRANASRGIVTINQPTTNEERCTVARQFHQDFEFRLPLLVDTVENRFDAAYAPWPLRFYVFSEGVVRYVARPVDGRFDVAQLRDALLLESQRG